MTQHLHESANAILYRALDLPAGDRQQFIAQATAGEPALFEEVRSMLSRIEQLDQFLADPLELPAELKAPVPVLPRHGDRVGDWRVEHELGRNGADLILLVRRDGADGPPRLGSMRLAQAASRSGQTTARFDRLRERLATLDHPAIAATIDAGATVDGRPYFVVERALGMPIDRYCAEQGLGLAQRATLFARFCDAVHYMHQHLIVHRDLKPADMLVDADGTIALLDVGMIGEGWPLNPAYASPDQLAGQPLSVSSDIYSLGAVLYGLVSGRMAHGGAAGAVLQAAPHASVVAPSQAVQEALAQDLAAAADLPDDPVLAPSAMLVTQLTRYFDPMLALALAPQAAARYASAHALARDLEQAAARLQADALAGPAANQAVIDAAVVSAASASASASASSSAAAAAAAAAAASEDDSAPASAGEAARQPMPAAALDVAAGADAPAAAPETRAPAVASAQPGAAIESAGSAAPAEPAQPAQPAQHGESAESAAAPLHEAPGAAMPAQFAADSAADAPSAPSTRRRPLALAAMLVAGLAAGVLAGPWLQQQLGVRLPSMAGLAAPAAPSKHPPNGPSKAASSAAGGARVDATATAGALDAATANALDGAPLAARPALALAASQYQVALADARTAAGDLDGARQAAGAAQALAALAPQGERDQAGADAGWRLGSILAAQGQTAAGLAALRKALALYDSHVLMDSGGAAAARAAADVQLAIARVLAGTGDDAGAEAALAAARSVYAAKAQANAAEPALQARLVDIDLARAAAQNAQKHGRATVATLATLRTLAAGKADARIDLLEAYVQPRGTPAQAYAAAQPALQQLRQSLADPRDATQARLLARAATMTAQIGLRANQAASACAYFGQADDAYAKLSTAGQLDAYDKLAMQRLDQLKAGCK